MTTYFETKEQYIAFRTAWAKAAQAKKLTASHMMLYNIIRGKDPQHGFTPFQRPSKYHGMGMFNRGAYQAYDHLRRIKEQYIGSKYLHDWAEEFINLFDGTLTLDDIQNLNIPKVEPLWTTYGKGLLIAKNIPEGFKAKTVNDLLAFVAEEAQCDVA